jgi:TRAP-type C4-dicarboxylate transport system substrate-binding protein
MYTPADLPVANALQETGFSYSDPLVAMVAVTEFSMTDPEQLAEWKKVGIVFGGGYSTPGYCLMCTKPVRDMEEIKGKKLRTSGAANSRWAESVGAVPVNVPSSEMYTGLEKGSIDCATNVVSDLKDRSLWDVAKHTTLISLGMYWGGWEWGWNRDYWNKELTADERRIIFNVSAQAIANLYVGYQKAMDDALAQAAEHKVNVYQPSADLLASLESFNTANRSEVVKMAREKYKIQDPEALFSRFEKVIKKWQSRFAQVDRKDAAAIGKIIKEELYDKIDAATYGQ